MPLRWSSVDYFSQTYVIGSDNLPHPVWLFSRNDASGNLAVVIAAVIVAWGETAWPDLAVAFVIAGLFLHSAWSIVKDAQGELHEAGAR